MPALTMTLLVGLSKRQTPTRWPGLEVALFEWQKRMERTMMAITGAVLQATAAILWGQLAQYKNIEMPKMVFHGWLHNFKRRDGIRQRRKHGEAASVKTSQVLTLCITYSADTPTKLFTTWTGQHSIGKLFLIVP
jgi:hypothetical protein